MKKIDNIKLAIGESEENLRSKAAKIARIAVKDVKHFKILKKSLDARDKNAVFYTYNVELSASEEVKPKTVYPKASGRVAVVGAGPCGLFCALYLARCGMRPTVFERGCSVDERKKKTDLFASGGALDPECNVQFGEGGAGAFSDGKLNTQVNNSLVKQAVEDFAAFGAPSEIVYLAKPHIGSDRLPDVIKNIRKEIISLGGEFVFDSKVFDFVIEEGRLRAIKYVKNGVETEDSFDETVLAIGHSSRDTFERLFSLGVAMEQKDFAVGFRVEHLQSEINKAQYGEKYYGLLPSADYRLASHAGERDVFTFCMCPGGYVMPAASEPGGVVVNGMSEYLRDGVNANSAIVCRVDKRDFIGEDALGGVRFQREIERKAYAFGGGDYKAPVQTVRDFLKGRTSSTFGAVKPSYPRGVTFAPLNELFNDEITRSIAAAIVDMGKKIKCFDGDGLFTAVESRTSSPLRILRDEKCQSVNVEGLYPAGEGAGYAGGITSAAADGIRVALAIANKRSE